MPPTFPWWAGRSGQQDSRARRSAIFKITVRLLRLGQVVALADFRFDDVIFDGSEQGLSRRFEPLPRAGVMPETGIGYPVAFPVERIDVDSADLSGGPAEQDTLTELAETAECLFESCGTNPVIGNIDAVSVGDIVNSRDKVVLRVDDRMSGTVALRGLRFGVAVRDFEMLQNAVGSRQELKRIMLQRVKLRALALSRVTEKAVRQSRLSDARKEQLNKAYRRIKVRQRARSKQRERGITFGLDLDMFD